MVEERITSQERERARTKGPEGERRRKDGQKTDEQDGEIEGDEGEFSESESGAEEGRDDRVPRPARIPTDAQKEGRKLLTNQRLKKRGVDEEEEKKMSMSVEEDKQPTTKNGGEEALERGAIDCGMEGEEFEGDADEFREEGDESADDRSRDSVGQSGLEMVE